MLCPRVSSRGLFFLFFLVCLFFLFFFEFFCFFHSEAFIGYRPEKKTKQIRRNPKKQRNKKKQSLGKKLCPRVSSTGLFFFDFLQVFCFFTRMFSSATGVRKKQNKLEENQKNKKKQKNKVLGKMLCPRVSSTGLFFFYFLQVFCFFTRTFSSATGVRKKQNKLEENQKNKKKQKNKVLGKMLCPRVSSTGLFFFHFLQVVCFFTRMFSSATGVRKKQNKLEENQKNKKNKKTKSWEKCCAQGFPPGDCFFCFFGFLVFFNFFWFLIFEFVWHMSDIITKTNIFGRYKNQPPFQLTWPCGSNKTPKLLHGNCTGAQAAFQGKNTTANCNDKIEISSWYPQQQGGLHV